MVMIKVMIRKMHSILRKVVLLWLVLRRSPWQPCQNVQSQRGKEDKLRDQDDELEMSKQHITRDTGGVVHKVKRFRVILR